MAPKRVERRELDHPPQLLEQVGRPLDRVQYGERRP